MTLYLEKYFKYQSKLYNQRLMTSALFDSLVIPGGWYHPPRISEYTGNSTMKFLPDVTVNKKARNQINVDKISLAYKLQTEMKKPYF